MQNLCLAQLVNLLMKKLDLKLGLDVDLEIVLGRLAIDILLPFWLIMMKGAA